MSEPDVTSVPILAKPHQQNPHSVQKEIEDAYLKAHANSDVDSGAGAIHHTLGRPGGAADFGHEHGVFSVADISIRDYVSLGIINVGTGGSSRVYWQTLSKHLVNVTFVVGLGVSSGFNASSKGFFYKWSSDFLQQNKISPVRPIATLDALYFSQTGFLYKGSLVYEKIGGPDNYWVYYWPTDDANKPWMTNNLPVGATAAPVTTFTVGDLLYATGTYQYA